MDYRTEFPDFDTPVPAMPEGFEDQSWHNDAMPHFWNKERRLGIWIDYTDTAKREFTVDDQLFSLEKTAADGAPGTILASSNDWQDILDAISACEYPGFVSAEA